MEPELSASETRETVNAEAPANSSEERPACEDLLKKMYVRRVENRVAAAGVLAATIFRIQGRADTPELDFLRNLSPPQVRTLCELIASELIT